MPIRQRSNSQVRMETDIGSSSTPRRSKSAMVPRDRLFIHCLWRHMGMVHDRSGHHVLPERQPDREVQQVDRSQHQPRRSFNAATRSVIWPSLSAGTTWVCAAAGPGIQDSRSKIFCLNPVSPSTNKLIDVYNKTINGVPQGDPNWPTSEAGQGHRHPRYSGGTGRVVAGGDISSAELGRQRRVAIFNLATNTWSLVTNADIYWSGHVSHG